MHMNITDETDLDVDLLFRNMPDKNAWIRCNPVTGGRWLNGVDPIGYQKKLARQALRAGAWRRANSPAGAPALPLNDEVRESIKRDGGLSYVIVLFARSLAMWDYVLDGHPPFDDYARGVMASPLAPDFLTGDASLLRLYPPKPLPGLGAGLIYQSGQ
jgi:hypothetical protein